MLFLATSLKLIAEIALMALAGQFIVGLLAGAKRENNFAWRLLKVLTDPFVKFARLVSPRVVIDRHVPVVAFLLLAFGWLAATLFKIQVCVDAGMQGCR
jgi:hypothetical protein